MGLVFSGIILGLNGFMQDLAVHNSMTIKDISYLSQVENVTNMTKQIQTDLTTKVTGFWVVDLAIMAVRGVIDIILFLGNSLTNFVYTMINSISTTEELTTIGIPYWVVPIVLGIVTIIIIFEVITALRGGKV
jgi:hypothetical protein